MQIIRDLLESPDWVILTFVGVYTVVLILITWKVTSWIQGVSGWNKVRLTEKEWKSKVNRLEEEIRGLREQTESTVNTKDKK